MSIFQNISKKIHDYQEKAPEREKERHEASQREMQRLRDEIAILKMKEKKRNLEHKQSSSGPMYNPAFGLAGSANKKKRHQNPFL